MRNTNLFCLHTKPTVVRSWKASAAFLVLALMLFSGSVLAAPVSTPVDVGTCFGFESKLLHEQRKYCVHLPTSYAYGASRQRHYPVLYMLDGENFFVSAADITDFMSAGVNGNYAIPEMIVVGVVNTNRTRDLTPSHSVSHTGGMGDFNSSGGGAAFLSFLDEELIPRIEHDYRTMPYRILAGHSFAGLAAIDAFQSKPRMFQATIAIDPSLWWDNGLMLKQAEASPPAGTVNNRIYIALANTPSIDGIYANIASTHMNAIRAYARFMQAEPAFRPRFKLDYFPIEEHGSVPLVALYSGLQFVFDHYKLTFAEGLNHPERIAAHFEKASAMLGMRFPPPEQLINVMGYMALNDLKDPAKAIDLFTLNTTYYPRSANAYDSLGEAYARAGEKARAIKSYETSVELNPDNENGKEWLKKLRSK